MDSIYLIGNKDKGAFEKYHIPIETLELPIDEMRFEVLKKDIILYCFDKMLSLEHGDIIIFNKYYYQGDYYTSYNNLIDYMIEHNVLEMKIDVVGFMMVNNKENEEILHFHSANTGVIKLRDIKGYINNHIYLDDIFIPAQKKNFLFQNKIHLKEIKILYSKRKTVCPYDTMNYVFHNIMEGSDQCLVVSYDTIKNFCKNNEKIILY